MRRSSDSADTGVLVVHGIGAQKRAETLEKLLAGLRRVDPDGVPGAAADGARGTVGGRGVRFYEVYWADLLGGELAAGAFQMSELQSIAWFPLLNARRGNYRAGSYSFAKLARWCVLLPILNVFILFAYHGAMLAIELGTIFTGDRRRRLGRSESGLSFFERVRKRRDAKMQDWWLARVMDEYVGDVFSYVNSARGAFHRGDDEPPVSPEVHDVYVRLMQRFYAQLTRAADECASIQIVAHSLGTVVTFHALSGLRLESDRTCEPERVRSALAKVEHLYTIGSPLEKIRFLWPRLASIEAFLALTHVAWDNFVSFFDPVAGSLKRFEHWGEVSNHRLLGGGFISGHTVYERSALFLKVFTEGLCGRALPLHVTPGERWRDRLMLAGETLLGPAVLVFAVVLGAAVLALGAAILPGIPCLLYKLLPGPQTCGAWFYIPWGVLGGAMMIGFFFAPIERASRVHAQYWAPQVHQPRIDQ